MTGPHYVRARPLSLKTRPEFNEAWVHERIRNEPDLLPLGRNLSVIEHERPQATGGYLDLLLSDDDDNRYEVEVMLGATDPSHIIRCIEYWDQERRRYPAYDHTAVLVAEDITSRFLNVIGLFAGSIPIIALQMRALEVGEAVVLDFVKVIDHRMLRTDDERVEAGPSADRAFWEKRTKKEFLDLVDHVLAVVNGFARPPRALHYTKSHIGIWYDNMELLVVLQPRSNVLHVAARVPEPDVWAARLEEAGMQTSVTPGGRVRVTFTKRAEMEDAGQLVREWLEASYGSYRDRK